MEPSSSAYVDVAQSSHSVAPDPLYRPAGHGVCAEAPVSSTKDPASTSAQLDCPVSSANVPTAQALHSPDPAPLYFPATHAVHSLAPVELLDVPAAQDVHDELPVVL